MRSTPPPKAISGEGLDQFPGSLAILTTLGRVLWSEIRIYRNRLLADFGLAFATASTGVMGPYLLYLVLRGVLRDDPVAPLPVLVASLFLAFAAFAILRFAHNNHTLATTEALFFSLKERLVDAAMRKPVAFYSSTTQASLNALVARDLDMISTRMRQHAGPMMAACLVGTGVLAVMLWLDWRLGALVVVLTTLYLYLSFQAHRRTAIADHRTRGAENLQQLVLNDILSGAREIRLFQIQKLHRARFAKAADALRQRNIAVFGTPVRGYNPRLEFVGSMILVGPVLLGLWLLQIPNSGLTRELIPAYLTYSALLLSNLRAMDRGLRSLAVVSDALNKLDGLLHYPEEHVAATPDLDEIPSDHTLQLIGITQTYGTKRILEPINLTIAPGEHVAVTGPSGSGKTTLANLILRIEEPTEGQLLLGGQPVQRFPLPLYLSYFSLVGQTTYLFHASVRDNIGMGWQHVPFDDIVRAAKLVRLHDAIMHLPAGYDTIIGAEGIHLSHGQRQRLALARALIRDPAILVLDEFTAGLDRDTEAAILADLVNSFPETTILCFTHSEAVMRRMDRVFPIPLGVTQID